MLAAPPTLALEVPSGDGATCSFSDSVEGTDLIVLEEEDCSGCDAGAGDLRVEVGAADGIVSVVEDTDVADADAATAVAGVSNSVGFFRGVACTLVISRARAQ